MDIETIYRLYFRDVFLFLQGLTGSETLAEELTQETFFKALDGLKGFDGRQDVRDDLLQPDFVCNGTAKSADPIGHLP